MSELSSSSGGMRTQRVMQSGSSSESDKFMGIWKVHVAHKTEGLLAEDDA